MIDVGDTVRYDGRLFRVRGVIDDFVALEGHPVVVSPHQLERVRPCICARPELCNEAVGTMFACRAGHVYKEKKE